ncbi:MAG: hypothetical protein M3Q49_21115 [Actinomycetota bacterium]|nr:hypothetical protein [Actinomycetota bacterium]MDP9488251.1 hypothetical protein [Actinomycetota bacterium]
MEQVDSYDVYIKLGEDRAGEAVFGSPVAHFMEERNAVDFARRLEAKGNATHIQKNTLFDASETFKETHFRDYDPEG